MTPYKIYYLALFVSGSSENATYTLKAVDEASARGEFFNRATRILGRSDITYLKVNQIENLAPPPPPAPPNYLVEAERSLALSLDMLYKDGGDTDLPTLAKEMITATHNLLRHLQAMDAAKGETP